MHTHASRQHRSATAPPEPIGLSRSVPAAGYTRRRPHGASSATGPSGVPPPPPPPPRPAWVGIADSKISLASSAAEVDFHRRRAAAQGLRRRPSGKENRAGGGENGRRREGRRAHPYSSSRPGQPRSSSIPGRGDKFGGDGSGHDPRRGKSAPPKTAAAASRVINPRTNKRKAGARAGLAASGSNGNPGARVTASSANSGGGRGGGGASHPPPYDSLGRQTLCRDGDGASATAKRRWSPADGWANGNHVGGDGGDDDGGSNTDDDDSRAEKSPETRAGGAAVRRRRENGVGPGRGVRGGDCEQVRGTAAARRFAGEPLREPFSRPFSTQEKGAEVDRRRSGLEGRQEEEGEEEESELAEGRGAAAAGDVDEGEGEEDSLDDKLPFMLASLKRVALTVHDLQGRCARLSHGEDRVPVTGRAACLWSPFFFSDLSVQQSLWT